MTDQYRATVLNEKVYVAKEVEREGNLCGDIFCEVTVSAQTPEIAGGMALARAKIIATALTLASSESS
jgi:hypothetical protein